MKRKPLVRFLPAHLAAMVAAWPQISCAVDQEWIGGTGGTWSNLANWTSTTGFPGEATATLAGEGAATDIATVAAANAATNFGINMSTMGGQLSLGAIDWNKTNTAAATLGNISTTVSGILQLNGAMVDSVPDTILRNIGAANLTISNVNTGTAAVTMGVQLGIVNGFIDVATGRTLAINPIISELNPGSGFTKTGLGTLTVNGANTFTGPVSITDGLLLLRHSAAAGTGPILVFNNDLAALNNNNLQLSGGITIAQPVTLENPGSNARVSIESVSSLNTNANTCSGDITTKGGTNQALIANSAPLNITGNILQDATTPGTSLFIRGANAGTISGKINLGTGAINKTDAGTWTINSTGNIMGNVNCSDGLLILGVNDAVEPDSVINMGQGSATTGRLQINAGITQQITGITTPTNSTSPLGNSINGPGSLDLGAVERVVAISPNTAAPNDVIINAPLTGSGGFNKTRDGTLFVTSAVTGPARLSAGRTHGTAAWNGGLIVETGAILGIGDENTAAAVTTASLTLDPGSILQVNAGTGVTDMLTVAGPTTVNGPATVDMVGSGPLTPGVYPFLTYTGATPGAINFAIGNVSNRATASISDNGTSIAIAVTAVDKLVWTGASTNVWEADPDSNWKLQTGAAPTIFQAGDYVIFNDTGANPAVEIAAAVTPAQVDFTNTTAKDYSISGTAPITGSAVLSKTGNGKVTLQQTNSYLGATKITDGLLAANFNPGSAVTPIPAQSPVTVTAPGFLQLEADNAAFNFPNILSGNGTVTVRPRTITGTATALGVGFNGINPTFSGTLRLLKPADGTFRLTSAPAASLGTATIEVQEAAQIYTANGNTYNNNITITGTGYADTNGNLGALRMEANSIWNGNITVSGTARINSHSTTVTTGGTISGNISGGDLEVNVSNYNNSNVLHLTGTNTHGKTNVGGGNTQTAGVPSLRLNIGKKGTTGTLGTGAVTVNGDGANGVLGFLRSDGYTLAAGNTITGAGSNLARTFVDIDCNGTGFANANQTIDLGTAGGVGGSIRVGVTVADALATLTGTLESGTLLIGAHNAAIPTTGATVILEPGTILSTNVVSIAAGGATTPLGNTTGASLTIKNGATLNAKTSLFAGEGNTSAGTISQEGGTVNVDQQVRVGHWGNATSTYSMNGGTLTLAGAAPTLTPSTPTAGGANATGDNNINAAAANTTVGGGIYVGIDGMGIFDQTAGTVTANWVVLDNRGAAAANASPGEDQYNLTGGKLALTSRFGIIARHPDSTRFTLDGGTIAHAAAAATPVVIDAPITLGAAACILDTAAPGNSFVLTKDITGAGNKLTITGGGTITLQPNSKAVLDGTTDGLGTTLIEANLSGNAALNKTGTGTTSLAGTNTHTGGTTLTAGILSIDGNTKGTTTVKTGGTLTGIGTVETIIAESGGIIAPGNASVASLSGTVANLQTGSRYAVEITAAATADKLKLTGPLTANGTIAVTLSGHVPVIGETFDIADASAITGTPVFDFTAAALTSGLAWDTSTFITAGTIRVVAGSDPFATWATANALTGPAAAKGADPDGDRFINLMEYATNADPNAAISGARYFGIVHSITAGPAMTLTVAVRKNAVFTASGTSQTATIDGVIYTIEGTSTLADLTSATVTELSPADAASVRAALTLPTLGTDWEWHSFRTDDLVTTDDRDFLRLKVTGTP